jgi:hypothetical protein
VVPNPEDGEAVPVSTSVAHAVSRESLSIHLHRICNDYIIIYIIYIMHINIMYCTFIMFCTIHDTQKDSCSTLLLHHTQNFYMAADSPSKHDTQKDSCSTCTVFYLHRIRSSGARTRERQRETETETETEGDRETERERESQRSHVDETTTVVMTMLHYRSGSGV